MQATEAAEDAEILILASDPTLRHTYTSPAQPASNTLDDISGFQLPDHSSSASIFATGTSTGVGSTNTAAAGAASTVSSTSKAAPGASTVVGPVISDTSIRPQQDTPSAKPTQQAASTVLGPNIPDVSSRPDGNTASAKLDQLAGREAVVSTPGRTAESDTGGAISTAGSVSGTEEAEAGVTDGQQVAAVAAADTEGSNTSEEASARARGRWGVPQQPFTAAGKGTDSGATAGELIRGDRSAEDFPATAVVGPPTTAEQLGQSVEEGIATAKQTVTTVKADSAGPSGSLQEEHATVDEATATAGEQSPELHGLVPVVDETAAANAEPATANAEPATATTTADSNSADRPAAGQYRRIAWAPVQNPFPAAGHTRAGAQQPPPSAGQAGAVATQPLLVFRTESSTTFPASQSVTAGLADAISTGTPCPSTLTQAGTLEQPAALGGLNSAQELEPAQALSVPAEIHHAAQQVVTEAAVPALGKASKFHAAVGVCMTMMKSPLHGWCLLWKTIMKGCTCQAGMLVAGAWVLFWWHVAQSPLLCVIHELHMQCAMVCTNESCQVCN